MRTVISGAAIVMLGFAASSVASATSVCAATSFAALAASGGCILGDLSFSNFDPGTMVDASQIQVTPSGTDTLIFSGPVIAFNGPLFVGSLEISSRTPIGNPINGISVAVSGGLLGSKEPVCLGAGNVFVGSASVSNCSNPSDSTQFVVGVGGLPASSSAMFTPVAAVDLGNSYVFSSNSPFSGLNITVSQVPEPGTCSLLLVAGFGASAFLCRRRFQARPLSKSSLLS